MALLQFSDTTAQKGIVELLGDLTGGQNATSSSYSLYKKTRDINTALARFFMLAMKAQGRWQVDDTNHTADFPIIFGDIVITQREYIFVTDENSNQILDVYKVRIKDTHGNWTTLKQRDLHSQDSDDDWLNNTTTGVPTEYDVTANGIVFNVIPNFSQDDSLEIYISRAGSYFVYTDTTKKPGIPEMFHEYLAIRPASIYCAVKDMPQKDDLKQMVIEIEVDIKRYYQGRNRDEQLVLAPPITNNHI